jgi:electron transfer flavoprotein beta subunit
VGFTVDPDGNDVALRKALAIGLDKGVMIKGGSTLDGWATAQVLAAALKGRPFDVILFGKQAIDDDAFQVPTMVAHLLGLPRVNVCTSFEVDGTKARLYVNGAAQPCLVVNDLKLGESRGKIALWARISSEACFSNLRVDTRK